MSIVHSPECFVFKIDWFRCSNHLNVSVKGFVLPRHWLITNLLQIYQITIAMYNSSSCRKNRIVCRRWSWVHLEAHLHLPLLHASLASDHNLTATHLGEDLCQSIHDYFISAHLFHGFQRIASGPDEQSHKVETRMILLQSNRYIIRSGSVLSFYYLWYHDFICDLDRGFIVVRRLLVVRVDRLQVTGIDISCTQICQAFPIHASCIHV